MTTPEQGYTTNLLTQNFAHRSLVSSRAKIEERNGKIYVIIDGRKIEADKNDLFGMNKSNPNEWLEKLVTFYDEEMKKNEEKLDFLEKQKNSITNALKKVKNLFWALLARCGVNCISQIADKAEQNQAIELYNQKWSLTFDRTSIGNELCSTAMDNYMDACSKGKFSNQLAFNRAYYG